MRWLTQCLGLEEASPSSSSVRKADPVREPTQAVAPCPGPATQAKPEPVNATVSAEGDGWGVWGPTAAANAGLDQLFAVLDEEGQSVLAGDLAIFMLRRGVQAPDSIAEKPLVSLLGPEMAAEALQLLAQVASTQAAWRGRVSLTLPAAAPPASGPAQAVALPAAHPETGQGLQQEAQGSGCKPPVLAAGQEPAHSPLPLPLQDQLQAETEPGDELHTLGHSDSLAQFADRLSKPKASRAVPGFGTAPPGSFRQPASDPVQKPYASITPPEPAVMSSDGSGESPITISPAVTVTSLVAGAPAAAGTRTKALLTSILAGSGESKTSRLLSVLQQQQQHQQLLQQQSPKGEGEREVRSATSASASLQVQMQPLPGVSSTGAIPNGSQLYTAGTRSTNPRLLHQLYGSAAPVSDRSVPGSSGDAVQGNSSVVSSKQDPTLSLSHLLQNSHGGIGADSVGHAMQMAFGSPLAGTAPCVPSTGPVTTQPSEGGQLPASCSAPDAEGASAATAAGAVSAADQLPVLAAAVGAGAVGAGAQGGQGGKEDEGQELAGTGPAEALVTLTLEVSVEKITGPGGRGALLLRGHDVTAYTAAEELLCQMAEVQLRLLGDGLPRHVLEFLSCTEAAEVPQQIGRLARHHQGVSLLFLDIVGFTTMSKCIQPEQVMNTLNTLFALFDRLVDVHGVQKVETAGDCYIVSCGVVETREDGFQHVRDAPMDPAESAARLMEFAKDMLAMASTVASPHDGQPLRVRIGMHSGDVVSGLIGSKLPKYSLFGDAMNTAARMESTSKPGRIQVTGDMRSLLPHEMWEPTGGVQVKGKGLMETYLWVPPAASASSPPPPRPLGIVSFERSSAAALYSQPSCAAALAAASVAAAVIGMQQGQAGQSGGLMSMGTGLPSLDSSVSVERAAAPTRSTSKALALEAIPLPSADASEALHTLTAGSAAAEAAQGVGTAKVQRSISALASHLVNRRASAQALLAQQQQQQQQRPGSIPQLTSSASTVPSDPAGALLAHVAGPGPGAVAGIGPRQALGIGPGYSRPATGGMPQSNPSLPSGPISEPSPQLTLAGASLAVTGGGYDGWVQNRLTELASDLRAACHASGMGPRSVKAAPSSQTLSAAQDLLFVLPVGAAPQEEGHEATVGPDAGCADAGTAEGLAAGGRGERGAESSGVDQGAASPAVTITRDHGAGAGRSAGTGAGAAGVGAGDRDGSQASSIYALLSDTPGGGGTHTSSATSSMMLPNRASTSLLHGGAHGGGSPMLTSLDEGFLGIMRALPLGPAAAGSSRPAGRLSHSVTQGHHAPALAPAHQSQQAQASLLLSSLQEYSWNHWVQESEGSLGTSSGGGGAGGGTGIGGWSVASSAASAGPVNRLHSRLLQPGAAAAHRRRSFGLSRPPGAPGSPLLSGLYSARQQAPRELHQQNERGLAAEPSGSVPHPANSPLPYSLPQGQSTLTSPQGSTGSNPGAAVGQAGGSSREVPQWQGAGAVAPAALTAAVTAASLGGMALPQLAASARAQSAPPKQILEALVEAEEA